MNRGEAIDKVRAYRLLLQDHFPLESVYLYGACASETYTGEGKIDVAVVVDRIKGDYFSVSPMLWQLRKEVDERIEPILIERAFDDAVFLGDVIKNGIEDCLAVISFLSDKAGFIPAFFVLYARRMIFAVGFVEKPSCLLAYESNRLPLLPLLFAPCVGQNPGPRTGSKAWGTTFRPRA